MKLKIGLGCYRVYLENGKYFDCRIGRNGNQVFSDNLENFYVPFNSDGTPVVMFEPCEYLLVTPKGETCKIIQMIDKPPYPVLTS